MSKPAERVDGWVAQLRRGSLELAILAALWGGRRYGIEIIRIVKEKCDLDVAEGTVYPILSRLKAEGYLDSEWIDAETGHPRKYHWLTTEGRIRAKSVAEMWVRFTQSLDSVVRPVLQDDSAQDPDPEQDVGQRIAQ
jgi:PadR family transcriptional regulator PadR